MKREHQWLIVHLVLELLWIRLLAGRARGVLSVLLVRSMPARRNSDR